MIDVVDPFDGTVVGHVEPTDAGGVEGAVARARGAAEAGAPPAWRRAAILDTVAARLEADRELWARRIQREAGKPIRAARVEAERAASTFRFAAAEARALAGEVVPLDAAAAGEGRLGFTVREPMGVVAAITPFNFPLNLVAHKLAPAVAAGCAVVLKPAERAPLSAVALVAAIRDAGWPESALQVVHGPGALVGEPLVTHPDVSVVTFTGSERVGRRLRLLAPEKRVLLELGGAAAVVVDADADLDRAADAIVSGGFGYAGQSCISVQRVYVSAPRAAALLDRVRLGASALVVGDPALDDTDVGPMIHRDEAVRVAAWVADARRAGARCVVGGGAPRGALLDPTVLTDVPSTHALLTEEVFGPVVVVVPVASIDEGIARANDTRFGLNVSVYTARLDVALDAARRLRAGTVLVNESPTWRADQMPYGGEGASGNTREGPRYAARAFTREKLVVLRG